MTLTHIEALPILKRPDPDFPAKVDDLFGKKLPKYSQDLNSLAGEIGALAQQVSDKVGESSSHANRSSGFADASALSAAKSLEYRDLSESYAKQSASAASLRGLWSEISGALAPPAAVLHDERVWLLIRPVADVSASQPGMSADWVIAPSVSKSRIYFAGSM